MRRLADLERGYWNLLPREWRNAPAFAGLRVKDDQQVWPCAPVFTWVQMPPFPEPQVRSFLAFFLDGSRVFANFASFGCSK